MRLMRLASGGGGAATASERLACRIAWPGNGSSSIVGMRCGRATRSGIGGMKASCITGSG